ncbi:hypothetical protein MSG28_015595 [Choristoneura fumiferana]|uniref:Uncharacterized protein n=1 Tax=Choristoneura fumiferana TaxID=7141 RepID=A0ACC0KAV7_CHOFU|nr:hypothetical protein MSG28_015595 [Choristoneura fumiferana]
MPLINLIACAFLCVSYKMTRPGGSALYCQYEFQTPALRRGRVKCQPNHVGRQLIEGQVASAGTRGGRRRGRVLQELYPGAEQELFDNLQRLMPQACDVTAL